MMSIKKISLLVSLAGLVSVGGALASKPKPDEQPPTSTPAQKPTRTVEEKVGTELGIGAKKAEQFYKKDVLKPARNFGSAFKKGMKKQKHKDK